MDSTLLFQDARREQPDFVISCCIGGFYQISLAARPEKNVLHCRWTVMDEPEKLFFFFEHLYDQPVFVFCGQDKTESIFFHNLGGCLSV